MKFITIQYKTGQIELTLPTNERRSQLAVTALNLLGLAFPKLTITYSSSK